MILVSIPFLISIVLVLIGANACIAIAIGWFIMVSIIRGLNTKGVVGEP